MRLIPAIILAAGIGFSVAALLGFPVIPWLKKLKVGQTILDIGPKWHKAKEGTPTMGGILIIAGTIVAVVVCVIVDALLGSTLQQENGEIIQSQTKLWSGILMALGFALIGFMDDYIKVVKKRNQGLSILQKTVLQVLVIFGYLLGLYFASGGKPSMYIPLYGYVNMGIWHWIFGAIVLYATTNAVNFTDGIDGLCASVTTTASAAFAVVAAIQGLSLVSMEAAALGGACVGFLMWNWNPAKVIMGDTGSMFLGGMIVALAYAIDCPLLIVPIGIIYVIEMLSDVIQIGYFKLTGGKRIFKMAPIHHHFEMNGWKEKKIVYVFSFINILGGLTAIAIVYFSRQALGY